MIYKTMFKALVIGLIFIPVFLNGQIEIKDRLIIQTTLQEDDLRKIIDFKTYKVVSPVLQVCLLSFDKVVSEDLKNEISRNIHIHYVGYDHHLTLRNTPNDSLFFEQWNMLNDGVNGNTIDADIDADEAWELATGGVSVGGDSIVIAVIDGGFDLSHPDVNWFKNYHDTLGNGIDDDQNGYIDDFDGWNAYGGNGLVNGAGSSQDHGTHVSGIIAAKGNNNNGISGIMWDGKVLPIPGSSGTESVVLAAYSYAYEMRKLYNETNGAQGAFIVSTNSSFGINYGNPDDFPLWCAMYDTLGSVGILSAVAGPNLNINIDEEGDMPGTCGSEYMICVTNTKSDDKKGYAGYGTEHVDLGAPGTKIWSTIPDNGDGSLYDDYTGTSMASPHVAGAIGLAVSYLCENQLERYFLEPDSFALTLKSILLNEVDSLSDLTGEVKSNGRLNLYQYLLGIGHECDGVYGIGKSDFQLLNVYPNPLVDEVVINGIYEELFIFDAIGNKIERHTQEERFSLSHLPSGLYFFKFSNGQIFKLIKL